MWCTTRWAAATPEPALRSMAWRGRYLVVGFANGEIPRIPLNLPLLKGCSLVGVFWGSLVRYEPVVAAAGIKELFQVAGRRQAAPGNLRALCAK